MYSLKQKLRMYSMQQQQQTRTFKVNTYVELNEKRQPFDGKHYNNELIFVQIKTVRKLTEDFIDSILHVHECFCFCFGFLFSFCVCSLFTCAPTHRCKAINESNKQ